MAEKARHAFGNSENLQKALDEKVIDSYDILFLDGDTEPKVGWVDKNGVVRIVENGVDVDLSGIEAEIATKANAEEVNAKIGEIETALGDVTNASHTHEKVKYEITSVPAGTLVNYREGEIRIMCPTDVAFTKQSVGTGGDPNNYYATFKTYVPNDDVAGYIEHLGDQVDSEILTDFSTDKYGRRYQPTWLALASYNETTGTWTYYGAKSTTDKYIGWDYQIDWYNADGVIIASDCIRINLSNENCHSSIKPFYGVSETEEIETKVEEVVEEKMTAKVEEAVATSNAYTDAKIAEISEASSYEIIEF